MSGKPTPAAAPLETAPGRIRDLVRDEVVLPAQSWVVKVGTSVLTGPDGTLDPARIDHLAEQISSGHGPGAKSRARQLRSGGRGHGPAWLEAPARQPAAASGRGGGRTGLFDPCV